MKYTFHISAQRSIILFLLLKLSVAGFAQPENKIATADKSIQQLLEWYDFELWVGAYPIIQNNYQALEKPLN